MHLINFASVCINTESFMKRSVTDEFLGYLMMVMEKLVNGWNSIQVDRWGWSGK